MIRGLKLTAVAASLAVASSAAVANEGWYATVTGGMASFSNATATVTNEVTKETQTKKFKAAYRVSGAVGYDMDPIRVEGEIGYQHAKNKAFDGNFKDVKAKLSTMTYFVNAFYDFKDVSEMLVPYVGVGLGAITVKSEIKVPGEGTEKAKKTKAGIQGIAGAKIKLTDNMNVNIDYRYMHSAKFGDTSLKSHSGNVGLSFYFA